MGPHARRLGSEVTESQLWQWQYPVPADDHKLVDAEDQAALESDILASP